MSKHRSGTRSPIKGPSLPQAGDGLQWEIFSRYLDLIAWWAVAPALCLLVAFWEWARYWWHTEPSPWGVTVLGIVFAAGSIVHGIRVRSRIRPLELGLRGERTVGQLLDSLRARGYRVFHDLAQGDWNVDHVLIGPGGVFAVETKTHSKPNDHDAKIVYDGEMVLIDGHEPDRDPVKQAKASARAVRQLLLRQTGEEYQVKPVVIYPGWFVERTVRDSAVYVANETWFMKSFDREHSQRLLDDAKIKSLAAAMERELRAS